MSKSSRRSKLPATKIQSNSRRYGFDPVYVAILEKAAQLVGMPVTTRINPRTCSSVIDLFDAQGPQRFVELLVSFASRAHGASAGIPAADLRVVFHARKRHVVQHSETTSFILLKIPAPKPDRGSRFKTI
jgi:hypothetical protein